MKGNKSETIVTSVGALALLGMILVPAVTGIALPSNVYLILRSASNVIYKSPINTPTESTSERHELEDYRLLVNRVGLDPESIKTLNRAISLAASTNDIDHNLLRAVIYVESNFNPKARSKRGAVGLMQLTSPTAKEMGVLDRLDPSQNIQGGSKYLRELLNSFNGDIRLALAAYNAGPTAVRYHGGIPPYPETKAYVKKVLTTYTVIAKG